MEKILKCIERGKNEGAKVEAGGFKIDRKGYFIHPTLFSDVNDDMSLVKEEIFGPVQHISSFKEIDEVIVRANDTKYGLAAGIFGNNIHQINDIVQNVRAGSIWVNCYFVIDPAAPFGGFKMSGLGREGGQYGMNDFSEVKSVFIKTSSKTIESVIEDYMTFIPKEKKINFISCYLKSGTWGPGSELYADRTFRLAKIPTLIKWNGPQRLEMEELTRFPLLRLVFEEEFENISL